MTPETLDALFERLARKHLLIPSLAERKSDGLDFHDVSVWGVKAALQAAFEAGQQAGSAK